MKFRPCIDLHSGQVKQIVGSTLTDEKETVKESLATNFETDRPAGELLSLSYVLL
jgi:phosphoribosylformimino-5-aminoimidazole carboxamide ribotide isomerase